MAWTFKLRCGETEVPLVFNRATQSAYRLEYNARIQADETAVLTHNPDRASSVPVSGFDPNRSAFFTLQVGSSPKDENWNDTIDNAAVLMRLVDGENQQALRYFTCGDVNPVYLDIQPDGATRQTHNRILWGFVDTGGSPYGEIAKKSMLYNNVVIALQLEPYGEGDEICLCNEATNPDMSAFTGSPPNQIADGFQVVGAPDTLQNGSAYISYGSSMQVITNAGSEGIESIPITIPASTDVVGYIWINFEAGAGFYTIQLRSGASVVDTLTTSESQAPDDADLIQVVNGLTWYRFDFSGNAPNADYYIRVTTNFATDTFNVDNVYLQSGTTVIPPIFSSGCTIVNRGDGANVNYVDVSGIPGDADALMTAKVTLGTVTVPIGNFVIGNGRDGTTEIGNQPTWLDNDAVSLAGSFTKITGTGTSEDNYHQYIDSGSGSTVQLIWGFKGFSVEELLRTPRRIFVIAKSTSTSALFYASSDDCPSVIEAGPASPRTTEWQIVGAGLIQGKNVTPNDRPNAALKPEFDIVINVDVPAGATIQIDGLYLPFAQDGFTFGPLDAPLSAGDEYWLVGGRNPYAVTSESGKREATFGTVGNLAPVVNNRIVFGHFGSFSPNLNDYNIDDEFTVELCIKPRTRHLLGVL